MNSNLKELQTIPGVGKSISKILWNIGIENVSDLKGKDPEELYLRICADQGCQIDRCVLYVCRSSVYFAENKNPDLEKLKWWNCGEEYLLAQSCDHGFVGNGWDFVK